MDAKPYFLHKHHLLFDYYQKQEAFCDECNQQIDGRAFTCERCKFWLHDSCAERKLPLEISHPDLPSKLSLQRFYDRDFNCDKCFTLSRGIVYSNNIIGYDFKLDAICAFSTNDQTLKEESEISKDIGKKNQHFCHKHSLTLFNYRKVRKYEYCCSWCEKPLSGKSYGCFNCSFFLHHFCLYTIPNKILQHPFHPSHPLYIHYDHDYTCSVCKKYAFYEYSYFCAKCKFHLHPLCAKLKPTLRHECHHEHYLTYIVAGSEYRDSEKSFKCQKCNSWGDMKKSAHYRCVQCNWDFHFECLIPSTIRHKYHRHSLTIMTSFREDDSGEYFCDICEKERNPNHHVYCCKKCSYIAHIECALDKVIDAELYEGSTSSSKHEETEQKDPDFSIQQEIQHFTHVHPHPLIFMKEVIQKRFCQVCREEVCDQGYGCEICPGYYWHKTCAELPYEVLHPLHSLDHPLILVTGGSEGRHFRCDKCLDISRGYMYRCFLCNFKLDIKCVVGTASNIGNQGQGPKKIERPSTATITKLFHFIHNHELLLVNFGPSYKNSFWCDACCLNISGPAYCCLDCGVHFHKSCLGKLPEKIQIPSHPHTLLPFPSDLTQRFCIACKSADYAIFYHCSQCDIYIHFWCAGSLLKSPLSSKSHSHNLYLFPRDKLKLLRNHRLSECGKCNKPCREESIYRCIECDANFHLQCVEISYKVKSKRHIHPLTLKDCFVEDDSTEFYCDICEEERDPKADVYYCEECDGFFVAHIQCVVDEVEEVLQQYGPYPYSPP